MSNFTQCKDTIIISNLQINPKLLHIMRLFVSKTSKAAACVVEVLRSAATKVE